MEVIPREDALKGAQNPADNKQSFSATPAHGRRLSTQDYPGSTQLAGPLGHLVSLEQIAPHSGAAARPISTLSHPFFTPVLQADTQVGHTPDVVHSVERAVAAPQMATQLVLPAVGMPVLLQASEPAAFGSISVGPAHAVGAPPLAAPHVQGPTR
jgi:hypothetical protein